MIQFYFLLGLASMISVGILLLSLKSKNHNLNTSVDTNAINVEIAKARISEVSQHLDDNEKQAAELELQATLLDDLQENTVDTDTTHISGVWSVLAIGLVPAAAILIYLSTGNPEFVSEQQISQSQANSNVGDLDINVLIKQLEQKLQEEPENPQGWELAARTYMNTGDYQKANEAYRKLNELIPGNPDFLTSWADASIMASGNIYTTEIQQRIEQALSVDPSHTNALWIAGLGSQSLGNHDEAVGYFEKLLPLLGDNQQLTEQVTSLLSQSLVQNQSKQIENTSTSTPPEALEETTGTKVQVQVTIDPSIAAEVNPNAVVFIVAKAQTGPKAPLAVSRHNTQELPLDITLTNAMAMIPELNISSVDTIVVSARISSSGGAIRQPGDYISRSIAVKKQDENRLIQLIIDEKITDNAE